MPNPIERLRYFDGEYLRSSDFTDEQSYHVAMRRLMNLKLHLHGIVYGLEIVKDQDSVSGGPYFFSIAPGLAIDQAGREILVPAPYSLTNVLNSPGVGAGFYEVWICYQETETGLPAAGYLDCNVQNQNTRWQETFQVQLKALNGSGVFTDCGGVRLGVVKLVDNGALGLEITPPPRNVERTYVGIRAQRIIAPDKSADTFDITAKTTPVPDERLPGYLDIHPGVFARGNVVAKQNMVVGDDFILDDSTPASPSGNLKVTGDLFLNGDFYGFNKGAWYELAGYIQSMMPNLVPGSFTIPLPQGAGVTTAAMNVSVSPTTLANPSSAVMLPSITAVEWLKGTDLTTFGTVADTIQYSVTAGPGTAGALGSWNFPVTWIVTPSATLGSGAQSLPILTLVVTYLAIFSP